MWMWMWRKGLLLHLSYRWNCKEASVDLEANPWAACTEKYLKKEVEPSTVCPSYIYISFHLSNQS